MSNLGYEARHHCFDSSSSRADAFDGSNGQRQNERHADTSCPGNSENRGRGGFHFEDEMVICERFRLASPQSTKATRGDTVSSIWHGRTQSIRPLGRKSTTSRLLWSERSGGMLRCDLRSLMGICSVRRRSPHSSDSLTVNSNWRRRFISTSKDFQP